MLTIKECTDRQKVEQLAGQAGITPMSGVECFLAQSRGEDLGYCLYRPDEEKAEILWVEHGGDEALFDGLIRAVFFHLSQIKDRGAVFGPQVDYWLLFRYGFVDDNKDWVESMGSFLENCKNCEK